MSIKAVGAVEVGGGVVVGISDLCNRGKVPSRLQWNRENQHGLKKDKRFPLVSACYHFCSWQ